MPPTRQYAYASIKVFNRGHGDPICVDHGLGWYSILTQEWESGSCSVNGIGLRYLDCHEEVGLIHRAFLVPQDTRKSQWTFNGGSWEERQVETGRNVYRLNQLDGTPTLTSWAATSNYHRPLNAPVAFSLILPDSADNWDYTTYPPFIRVELNPEWGVQFTKEGTFLMRFVGGQWRAVQDLPTPSPKAGFADEAEVWMYARVERGQLGISFDFGRSYVWYAPPGEAVTLAAGKITVRGRGSTVTFGVHQLRLYTATFDSSIKELEKPRLAWAPDFSQSQYDNPLGTGGSVAFSDIGTPLARQGRYRITMTPGTQAGTPFTWYFGGAVYATHYRVHPEVVTTGNTKSTPFDATLRQVTVTKPYQLDGANASFTFYADAFSENDWNGYRWRKVEVWLGWRLDDGSLEEYQAFTGYIEGREVSWSEELSKVLVTFHLHNASARFKRRPWTPFRQLPLGGLTPNQAADVVLEAHGLNATYRAWHGLGNLGPIPFGAAEDPNELTHPEEYPWETLVRIFSERGLELGISDNGTLFTAPKDSPTGELARTLYAGEGAENVWEQVRGITYRTDYKQCGTAAMVYGQNATGQLVFACDVDTEAETNATSERFCPWSELWLKELPGTPDAGMVVGHLQALATECFRIADEGDTSIPLDPTIGRRQELAFIGFGGAGVPDGTRFMVLTETHTWECNRGYTSLESQMGIRRLN